MLEEKSEKDFRLYMIKIIREAKDKRATAGNE